MIKVLVVVCVPFAPLLYRGDFFICVGGFIPSDRVTHGLRLYAIPPVC